GSAGGRGGGVTLVDGKAGNEIGNGMRRGLIAIGGDTGDFPGVSMIAGSLLIGGQPGIRLGAGMKRGSIVVLSGKPPLLPTFRADCIYRPVFLRVYLRQLHAWGFALPADCEDGPYQRFSGDLVVLGKGEVLVWLH